MENLRYLLMQALRVRGCENIERLLRKETAFLFCFPDDTIIMSSNWSLITGRFSSSNQFFSGFSLLSSGSHLELFKKLVSFETAAIENFLCLKNGSKKDATIPGMVIESQTPTGLFTNVTVLPQLLKRRGYRTHAVGKWHLGYCNEDYLPTNRGFDTFFGKYLGGGHHYEHSRAPTAGEETAKGYDLRLQDAVDLTGNGTYSTFLFTDYARDLISNPSDADKDKPFFLYLAYQAVHSPLQG